MWVESLCVANKNVTFKGPTVFFVKKSRLGKPVTKTINVASLAPIVCGKALVPLRRKTVYHVNQSREGKPVTVMGSVATTSHIVGVNGGVP